MRSVLTVQDAVSLMERLAGVFQANRDHLNELDAKIGDGDHGLSMARGFQAVAGALKQNPPRSISEVLMQGGMQFNETSGSTIGILMFSGMREAGKAAAGKDSVELADLREMLAAAVAGIGKRGKAQPGQKTILDALHPALEALSSGLSAGKSPEEAVQAAAEAAREGMEATRNMTPATGRARWFAERSVGEIDPGAVSGYLIVKTVAEYLLSG